MPDYSNPLCNTMVFGEGGSGKTTFGFRYLLNKPAACRFIFDDRGQAADRLKLKLCGTEKECLEALSTRWVCFNPHVMFPGAKLPDAFRWFCYWVMQISKRGPGKKIFFVDEIWQWCDARSIPDQLSDIVRTGRVENLELFSCTHSPRDYHVDIRRLITEFVGFNTVEPDDLDKIRPYWPGVDEVATLPLGEFIAFNRETRATLRGKMF
jgi:hypothetical protein